MITPKVTILRGIPGSGKSSYIQTWYNSLVSTAGTYLVFSADHYFIDPITNEYKFDVSKLGKAHGACFRNFLEAVQNKKADYYIIDNTNIRSREISPYIQIANAFELDHEIITIWCEPQIAAARNTHGVPPDKVYSMFTTLLRVELSYNWNHTVVYASNNLDR